MFKFNNTLMQLIPDKYIKQIANINMMIVIRLSIMLHHYIKTFRYLVKDTISENSNIEKITGYEKLDGFVQDVSIRNEILQDPNKRLVC